MEIVLKKAGQANVGHVGNSATFRRNYRYVV